MSPPAARTGHASFDLEKDDLTQEAPARNKTTQGSDTILRNSTRRMQAAARCCRSGPVDEALQPGGSQDEAGADTNYDQGQADRAGFKETPADPGKQQELLGPKVVQPGEGPRQARQDSQADQDQKQHLRSDQGTVRGLFGAWYQDHPGWIGAFAAPGNRPAFQGKSQYRMAPGTIGEHGLLFCLEADFFLVQLGHEQDVLPAQVMEGLGRQARPGCLNLGLSAIPGK